MRSKDKNNYIIDSVATGAKIKDFRTKKGITATKLAEMLGLSGKISVHKWESGENVPTIDHLVVMSKIFKSRIDDIVVSLI